MALLYIVIGNSLPVGLELYELQRIIPAVIGNLKAFFVFAARHSFFEKLRDKRRIILKLLVFLAFFVENRGEFGIFPKYFSVLIYECAGNDERLELLFLHFFKINGEINYFFLDMPADKYYPYSNKQYGNAGKNDYDDTLIVLEKIQRTAKDKNGRY